MRVKRLYDTPLTLPDIPLTLALSHKGERGSKVQADRLMGGDSWRTSVVATHCSWLPVTTTRMPAPRPRTSSRYMSSAHGDGCTKLP